MRSLLWTLTLALLLLPTACRPKQKPPTTRLATTRPATLPSTQPTTRPLLDLSRGAGQFPLGTQPLTSPASLTAALRDGYLVQITPPDPDHFVTIEGTPPHLALLRVDMSNARIREDYTPKELAKPRTLEQSITARRMEYVADPLRYDTATARSSFVADDARLDVFRDPTGRRALIFHGARQGRFQFHASPEDFNRIMALAPGRAGKSSRGISIQRAQTSFTSEHPHTLAASVHLRARYVLLPLSLTLHGRLTVNPADGTLTYSEVNATGHDPGGLLAAAFLNPHLQSLNGKSQPALSFPDPQTQIQTVTFNATDGLTITITFARNHPPK